MLKKVVIWLGLTSFLFQALLFNALLLLSWEYAKNESETAVAHGKMIIPIQAYKNLHWLNDHEFIFGKYLCDVYKKSSFENKIAFIFKVDEKEKGIIEKLADHFAKTRTKKDILSPIFHFSHSEIAIAQHLPIADLKLNVFFLNNLLHADSRVDSPPPRI